MVEYPIELIWKNWIHSQEIDVNISSIFDWIIAVWRIWVLSLADVSIEVPPESKTGSKRLTEEEDDEYHQVQGREFISSENKFAECVCVYFSLILKSSSAYLINSYQFNHVDLFPREREWRLFNRFQTNLISFRSILEWSRSSWSKRLSKKWRSKNGVFLRFRYHSPISEKI